MLHREIVLDTETTGLDPAFGHRLVEIGCVELHNLIPTGRVFHHYINPERDVPAEAERVHGLSAAFLQQHPPFSSIALEFMAFIADAPLVIHNADFDLKFLNAELARLKLPGIPRDRALDTVKVARKKFPGARVSLDALCSKFNVDNGNRDKHGALLDATLLAEVYLHLCGGRQPGLLENSSDAEQLQASTATINRIYRPARPHMPNSAEHQQHAAMLEKLTDPLWKKAG